MLHAAIEVQTIRGDLVLDMDSFKIAMLFACQCKPHGDQGVLHPCVAQIVH